MRCLLPGYYVFRFGKTAESHVAMAANLKEPVYVQVRAGLRASAWLLSAGVCGCFGGEGEG